jgi:hypothetical protein
MERMSPPPAEVYEERRLMFSRRAAEITERFNRVATLRLVTFLAAVALAGFAIWRAAAVAGVLAAALLVAFVVLVVFHGRLARRRRRSLLFARLNEEALWRLARDWERLPLRHDVRAGAEHPYAADLDVFGRASLFHLLDTTTSPMGTARLRAWLSAPAAAGAVRERQAAVAELAGRVELREELQFLGRDRGEEGPDPEPFLRWAEGERWLEGRRALLWAARLSPPLLFGSLAAWLLHVLPVPVWPLFLIVNALVWLRLGGGTEAVLRSVRAQHGAFAAYADQLALLGRLDASQPPLRRLREAVTVDGVAGDRLMRRLDAILSFVLTAGMGSLQYMALQGLFLWNVHVLDALERWQRRVGGRARAWLDAIGDVEALAALAGLAHGNPAWAYPDVNEAADRIAFELAGHPLIEPGRRVDNDVTVGPAGTFLLVTGSNMSGKSTLLRTVGLNVVLAGAGGPVCARSLRLPPALVWTSMRIEDSLERGVSYFLAEVQRLKQIVDAACAAGESGPLVCYLLDEVLQGTNTAERQIAARGIIGVLVQRPVVGAVSTHDLTLADAPELSAVAERAHFRETVTVQDGGGPAMTFDYRLRPGLATSTNALRLLEIIGLRT